MNPSRGVWLVCVLSCGFPRPARVADDGGTDANDASNQVCSPSAALRCDGAELVSCDSQGMGETRAACAAGCRADELRCAEVLPSNSLAPYLDMTASERDLDLGSSATINSTTGDVTADGQSRIVRSTQLAQVGGPTIRVLIVHSLTASNVTVTGTSALAVVSYGDVQLTGVVAASATVNAAGPGAFNEAACLGGDFAGSSAGIVGAGGGGFGSPGGAGGSASNGLGTLQGGAAGGVVGNAALVPLRGGCDSGGDGGAPSAAGRAGGAIQIVSRSRIRVTSVLAANGSSFLGGGSGGGILLEAPLVQLLGAVVVNGGGGAGGCGFPEPGEDGRLDATPAAPGKGCPALDGGDGGRGAAGGVSAGNGQSVSTTGSTRGASGYGGGGVGRIRINTAPGGFQRSGVLSPEPSVGALATR